MLQTTLALRRTVDPAAGAARNRLFFRTHDRRTAYRTFPGHVERLGVVRARRGDAGHDFGDHVAGAAHDYGIADPDILAAYFICIVQCGIRHCHAADEDRRQTRHRCDGAGTSHLYFDVLHYRERLLCREFVRQRTARRARDEAELLLLVQAIDLVDDAIDFIRQSAALGADVAVERQ